MNFFDDSDWESKVDRNSIKLMRIEILIDPEAGEYEFSADGQLSVLKHYLKLVMENLEDENVVNQLAVETDN